MGEFAFFVADKVLGKLACYGSEEISLARGAKSELKKLKQTLSTITILLLDAEEKQTKSRGLTAWLARLKDVCYDIEDVLDDFAFLSLIKPRSCKAKVCHFFSQWNPIVFDSRMGHRMKEIRVKLDEIDKEKSRYSLSERDGGHWYVPYDIHNTNGRDTHSVVPSFVIQRHDDQEEINHLLTDDHSNDENVSVISIIGFGGLGKTTLATLVYNDSRVVENFKTRMWVCVSNHFDINRLVRRIINSATGQSSGDHECLEEMQKELLNALSGNKVLVVLDDVWDEKSIGVNSKKWDNLKTLLNSGVLRGSKIIITTRNESVGLLMNSVHMHYLEGLTHKDCMSLFIKRAFKNEVDSQHYPQLIEIGEGIVNKCKGVPLAVTTLGSLLHSKLDPLDWLHVRDDEIWTSGDDNIVLPALKLSYDALPRHLKPCFAFCSLFPKDYIFRSTQLVALWMTEDYLNCSGENQDFKETGLDYIRQFCSRSLFQVVEDTKSMIRFPMHDLAISVAQVEYSTVNCRPSDSFEMVRHVSLTAKDLRGQDKKVPSFMLELNKVRTILFPHEEETCSSHDVVKKCILRFKYMRVLNLSWFSFEEMPTSIGKLSHLRYLSLYKNELIRKLPNSICKLLHLQVLNLAFCKALEELPKDIGNLSNLRTLSLTTKQMYLPKGIGNLSSLSVLAFYACENLKSLGEEIQSLTTLQELWIDSCEELESMPPNMKLLTSLHTLVIISSEKLELVKFGEGTRGLQRFCMWISNLEALPHWLEESAETLQNLEICSFFSLKVLPEWLQSSKMLNRLVIKHSPELLLALPEGMHQLTALRQVEIDGCPELSESFKSQLQDDQNWSMFARHTNITLDYVPYTP